MRRGFLDALKKWEGFAFKIATPSMDWKKAFGTENAGASFGVIVENNLDVKIGSVLVICQCYVTKLCHFLADQYAIPLKKEV